MLKLLRQAFTLIELLVVIAIIGILSGLIVVSMGGMTNKANIARSQVFSNSLKNSLMLNLVAQYNFDDITDYVAATKVLNSTAGNVPDSWSTSEAQAYGGPILKNDIDCVSGQCLSFDGVDDYLNVPNSSPLNLGDGNKGSVEIWIKVDAWPSSGYPSIVKRGTGSGWTSGNYHISYWGGAIRYVIYGSSTYNSIFVSSPSVGVWHHYVLTWSGVGGLVKGYLDGVAVSAGTSQTIKADLGSAYPLRIGVGSTKYFAGVIDGLRIYDDAMPTSQVEEQYYAGLNNLLASGQINKEEYQNRLVGIK